MAEPVLTKPMRFVAEVSAVVRPLTRAFFKHRAEKWRRARGLDPGALGPTVPDEDVLARQRPLLRRILDEPAQLATWMESEVILAVWDDCEITGDAGGEDPHNLLPLLADRIAPDTRRRLDRALSLTDYGPFMDAFWFCLSLQVRRLQYGALPQDGDGSTDVPPVLARRVFRATADIDVEIRDVDPAEARRRSEAQARRAKEWGEPWWNYGAPVTEDDLRAAQDLLDALLETPDVLDQMLRLEILGGITAGHLYGKGPQPAELDDIFGPLVEEMDPAELPSLVRYEGEVDFFESFPHLMHSIDVRPERVSVLEIDEG